MSPTEIDLRNALRDGEGDGPDPDRIVNLGRARRAQRRTRVLSTTAAVVLAAGIATGGAFLARGSSDDTGGGRSNGGDYAARQGSRPAASSSSAGSSASSAGIAGTGSGTNGVAVGPPTAAPTAASAACPAAYPRLMLPGGGGTGQFGASGKLFAKTPVSLVVCAYGADGATGRPASLVLTGANASRLADSLEGATTTRVVYPCPTSPASSARLNRLAIIGTAADGTVLPTVTTQVASVQCNIMATNGTAVRYQWRPPSGLEPVLLALTPRQDVQQPTDPAPGHVSKTPIR